MPAYFIVDLDIRDAHGFEDYRRVVPSLIEKYGGRYLVRGGAFEVLEGEWAPRRLTVIEFPSAARAKDFYGSKEYREIIGLRLKSARTNLVLVEGV